MGAEYFRMGSSIADRTNRITLVKLVAERLGINREGYVQFFYVNKDIVIRKGEKEYDPDTAGTGFYMGSSVVDKDNRVTIIKLVVQNLRLKEGDYIEFYLHDQDVSIKKVPGLYRLPDFESMSSKNREIVSRFYFDYLDNTEEFRCTRGHEPTEEELLEILNSLVKKYGFDEMNEQELLCLLDDMGTFMDALEKSPELIEDAKFHSYLNSRGADEEYKKWNMETTPKMLMLLKEYKRTFPLLPRKTREKQAKKRAGVSDDEFEFRHEKGGIVGVEAKKK